ncbi:MAG TPA: DUF3108 domain-containing protein [Pyrinomonadaceae bacterium]|nr:DUF3108 domain-containing protein [Pyrinomonadaceae bacterium]
MERIPKNFSDRLRPIASTSARLFVISLFCLSSLLCLPGETAGQDVDKPRLRVGEKLSYNISFGKFTDAGNAELFVASRGKLGLTDAIEIRSRVKTVDLVSAAFMLLDESRTVYAAPDTGLPLYVSKISQVGAIPREMVSNYLTVPTSNFDLITLLYRVRETGGIGTFPFLENDRLYSAVFTAGPPVRIKTDAGEFETITSSVQSEFLTSNGVRDLKINFATDESRIPVMFRFMTARGEFKAILSSFTLPDSDVAPLPTPVPTPPMPATPKPTPTPLVYVENRPLLPELGFVIGETLDFRVTNAGVPAGVITLSAVERQKYKEKDSLLLTATVTRVEPGNPTLRLGDSYRAQVDPDTLTPTWAEAKFLSNLAGLKQNITFDRSTGAIAFGGARSVDGPVGTHSLLSLIYAIRSFNLKPSRDVSSPVNDTRVAVFWETKPYIFTLRPSNAEEITVNGDKMSAQLISIKTEDPTLDAMGLKVWLSTEGRVPVRFSAGTYVAELIPRAANAVK